MHAVIQYFHGVVQREPKNESRRDSFLSTSSEALPVFLDSVRSVRHFTPMGYGSVGAPMGMATDAAVRVQTIREFQS